MDLKNSRWFRWLTVEEPAGIEMLKLGDINYFDPLYVEDVREATGLGDKVQPHKYMPVRKTRRVWRWERSGQ